MRHAKCCGPYTRAWGHSARTLASSEALTSRLYRAFSALARTRSLGSHLAQAGPTLIRLGVRDASDLSLLHESDLEELPLVTRRKVLSLAEP